MKKYFIAVACGLLLTSFFASAQKYANTLTVQPEGAVVEKSKGNMITENKNDLVEVVGLGTTSFLASSNNDGFSPESKKSLKITIALQTSGASKENYQLVFYSQEERVLYVAASNAGTTYVYYPISLYDAIKSKLDQSLASKKKIQLKITQNTDGYREGVLIL